MEELFASSAIEASLSPMYGKVPLSCRFIKPEGHTKKRGYEYRKEYKNQGVRTHGYNGLWYLQVEPLQSMSLLQLEHE